MHEIDQELILKGDMTIVTGACSICSEPIMSDEQRADDTACEIEYGDAHEACWHGELEARERDAALGIRPGQYD